LQAEGTLLAASVRLGWNVRVSGAWYRFRAEIRHGGWRFLVLTALLLGIGGGVALSAIAGARRTSSAFTRLEAATVAADVLVNPDHVGVLDLLTDDVMASMPGVASYARIGGGALLGPDGNFLEPISLTADQRFGVDIERPAIRAGRVADPERAEEVFADPVAADLLGLEIGDVLEAVVLTEADAADGSLFSVAPEDLRRMARDGELGTRVLLTLVGIGVRTGDVIPGASNAALHLTPAFAEAHDPLPFFGGLVVRLDDGEAGVGDFITRVRALAPGVGIDFQTTAGDRDTITRAVTPQSVSLYAFGAVTAIGVIAAVGQAFSRRAKLALAVESTLSGLGHAAERAAQTAPPAHRVRRARRAGPDAGRRGPAVADLPRRARPLRRTGPRDRHRRLVLAVGTIALVVTASVASYLAVVSAQRRRWRIVKSPLRLVRFAAGGLPPTVTTGAMYALESGERATSVPAKSTIVSTAVGIAVVVGALTFAASLDRFVTDPKSYGWDFDAVLQAGDTTEEESAELAERIPDVMAQLDSVEGWATASFQQANVAGATIPVMGISESIGVPTGPTLVRGRMPAARDEVALGAVTAREARVGVGDEVTVGFDQVPAEVVGIVVLPGIGNYQGSDQAALGVGALFTEEGFAIATSLGFVNDDQGPGGVLVSVDGDGRAALARLQAEIDAVVGPEKIVVEGSIRPSDVGGYAAIRSTPLVLAAILGVLAAMTVGHGLIVSVRQRRRDFAVFRSLGFTRRQVMATVGWQATTVAVLGVLVGLPIGILVGRVAWAAVARRLGIVNMPVMPILAVASSLPIALVLSNIVAAIPARLGVRTRPGQELRAE
jgi:hypothetical protein